MFKLLVYISLIVFFNACGVETSSSSETVSTPPPPVVVDPVEDPKNDNSDYRVDIVDANPIVDHVDDNISDNNGDDTKVEPVVNDDQNNSDFNTTNAIKDQFACAIGDINNGFTNNVLVDDSNDYLGAFDLEDGLGITSRISHSEDTAKSEVALFYYDLKPSRTFKVITVHGDEFTMSIDTGWAENDEKVIYVRTPKNVGGLYSCFRYGLSSINTDGDVSITKVYRTK